MSAAPVEFNCCNGECSPHSLSPTPLPLPQDISVVADMHTLLLLVGHTGRASPAAGGKPLTAAVWHQLSSCALSPAAHHSCVCYPAVCKIQASCKFMKANATAQGGDDGGAQGSLPPAGGEASPWAPPL